MNGHLDEPVEMLSFPPSIMGFGSRILALFAATFVIHVLASRDLGLFFYSDPFLVVAGAFSLY